MSEGLPTALSCSASVFTITVPVSGRSHVTLTMYNHRAMKVLILLAAAMQNPYLYQKMRGINLSIQSGKILVLLMLFFSFNVQPKSLSEITTSGVLKVGIPGDYAPLAWHDTTTDKLQGFDIDLVTSFGNSLNTRVEFVQTTWSDMAYDLKEGKFDIAAGGITFTKEREKQFSLSRKILTNGKIAISSCNISSIFDTLENIDKENVRVAVNPGGTNQSFVNENIHHAKVVRMKNNLDTIQSIRDRKTDIMFTDLLEGYYYHLTEPGVLCLSTTRPFKGTDSIKVWMMNKDNTELLRIVNIYLQNANLTSLKKKWHIR